MESYESRIPFESELSNKFLMKVYYTVVNFWISSSNRPRLKSKIVGFPDFIMQAAARRQFLMVGWPFRAPVNFCLFLMKMARPVAIQYITSYIDRRQSTVDSVRMQFIRNYRWVFKFVGRRLNAKENMLKL